MPGYHGDPTNGGKCQGKSRIATDISILCVEDLMDLLVLLKQSTAEVKPTPRHYLVVTFCIHVISTVLS